MRLRPRETGEGRDRARHLRPPRIPRSAIHLAWCVERDPRLDSTQGIGGSQVKTGWFADIANVDDPLLKSDGYRWQPCLQLGGWCPSLDVWFATEAECERFIKDEILGRGMYPEN